MDDARPLPTASVQVDHLRKCFDGKTVIDVASFSVLQGEAALLIGPSGSGKSTLLKCIAGALIPDSGSIIFNPEFDVEGVRRVALLPQNALLFPYLNVGDNVAFGMRRRGHPEKYVNAAARRSLSDFGLLELAHEFPRRLPLEKKVAALVARTLAEPARLFLFDEPLVGVRPEWKYPFLERVRNVLRVQNAASIFTAHDADEAQVLDAKCYALLMGSITPSRGEAA